MEDEFSEVSLVKPGWVKDPDSGKLLPVEWDDFYRKAVRSFHEAECKHEAVQPMVVQISDGRDAVFTCCLQCGTRVGTAMSQKDKAWVASLERCSADISEGYDVRRKREWRDLLLEIARKQRSERGQFTQAYSDYISSNAWREKRAKVLKRCAGVCEGCGDDTATEVHHLTYAHLMDEFLFELVGLCHSCHERMHSERDDQAVEPT